LWFIFKEGCVFSELFYTGKIKGPKEKAAEKPTHTFLSTSNKVRSIIKHTLLAKHSLSHRGKTQGLLFHTHLSREEEKVL